MAHQAALSRDFPGKNTGAGSHSLLQGIFPIQGSNPCLLHWQEGSFLTTTKPPGKPILLSSKGVRGDPDLPVATLQPVGQSELPEMGT